MSARLCIALTVSIASSCVSGSWDRVHFDRVPDSRVVASLRPGESDLGEALAKLGAPLYVWETRNEGVALAFGGRNERKWGISVSVPVARGASGRFDYDDRAAKVEGCVLIFDASNKLEIVRSGLLQDIRATVERRRPSLPEDDPAHAP